MIICEIICNILRLGIDRYRGNGYQSRPWLTNVEDGFLPWSDIITNYEFVQSSHGRFFSNAQKSTMGLCSNRLHGWGMIDNVTYYRDRF